MTYPMCTEDNPCPDCAYEELPPSDEALARLRSLLASEDVFADAPVVLTVFTAYGECTVENVDESSIRLNAGTLTCEAQDGTSNCPLYTFGSVQGYRTTFR